MKFTEENNREYSKKYLIRERGLKKVYIENVGGEWQLVVRYAGLAVDIIKNPTFEEVEEQAETAIEWLEDLEDEVN